MNRNNLTIIAVYFKTANRNAYVNKVIVEYLTVGNFWEASREANECPSSWPPKEQILRPIINEIQKKYTDIEN